jgi:hypothetical protein
VMCHGRQVLQLAWMRDSLSDALRRRQLLVLRCSIGVAFLTALIALPVLRWQWLLAQSRIIANGAPLAAYHSLPQPIDGSPSEVNDIGDGVDSSTSQLAEVDPVRPTESLRFGSEGTAPKQPSHVHTGSDLEHEVPSPFDVRESKPVY